MMGATLSRGAYLDGPTPFLGAVVAADFEKRLYRIASGRGSRPDFKGLPGASYTGGGGHKWVRRNGVWQNLANGELGEGDGVGLSVYEERQNLNVGAGNPAQWPATKTMNGVTMARVATGVEDGVPYGEYRLQGVATGSYLDFDLCNGTARWNATPNQPYTVSSSCKRVAGSTANVPGARFGVVEEAAAFAFVGLTGDLYSLDGSLSHKRNTRVFGATAATGRATFVCDFVVGQPIDITLRLYRPNVYQGADILDPPILQTTAAAATRTRDLPELRNLGIAPPFTVVVTYELGQLPLSGTIRNLLNFGDSQMKRLRIASDGLFLQYVDATGALAVNINTGMVGTTPGRHKAAIRIAKDNFAICANGGNVYTDASSEAYDLNVLRIGHNGFSEQLNDTIANLRVLLGAASNAQLQALTAP